MVVPVFIISCQVSEKWNSGPRYSPGDEYSHGDDERPKPAIHDHLKTGH